MPLVAHGTVGQSLGGVARCSANMACTSSLEAPPAPGTTVDMVTYSTAAAAAAAGGSKKQKMAQTWVVLSEEEEEEWGGSSSGGDFSDEGGC